MSWLDLIPTVGEMFDFAACRMFGHAWGLKFYRDEQNGLLFRKCETCGKKERVK